VGCLCLVCGWRGGVRCGGEKGSLEFAEWDRCVVMLILAVATRDAWEYVDEPGDFCLRLRLAPCEMSGEASSSP